MAYVNPTAGQRRTSGEIALTADAGGRAQMATSFFNAATLAAKIANGAFAATTAIRALFADGIWTNAKLAVPRITVYQEAIAVTAFTDGGGTSGTLDLATTIPAGARFLNSTIHGITGFAGDTSAAITIGDGTDVDRYNTGTPSVFATAAAGVDLGAPSGTAWHSAAKTPKVTVTTGADFTACKTNAAGVATITLVWIEPV